MEFIFSDVQLYFHSELNYFCYMHKPSLSIFNSNSCSSVVSNSIFLRLHSLSLLFNLITAFKILEFLLPGFI